MARPPRLQLAGATYHVTARGNRRQPVFSDDRDRERFLELLGGVAARNRWRCHAFCLMPNHYHLVLTLGGAELSAGMQRLNGSYAQGFNHRHALDGHLFQGRFYSVLVESTWHLVELARYVVLNPVRAGLCARAGDWHWSSYRAATGAASRPGFLKVDWLLGHFGADPARARAAFRAFVDDAPGFAANGARRSA